MKLFQFTKLFSIIAVLAIFSACSDDDPIIVEPDPISHEGFVFNTESQTNFFINSAGEVEVTLTANVDHNTTEAVEKGFVYGLEEMPEANATTKVIIDADGEVSATIEGLDKSRQYFIRGYIVTTDGRAFYGNQVTYETPDNTAETRSISLSLSEENTSNLRELKVSVSATDVSVEAPSKIAVEYSESEDFSDSEMITNNTDVKEASANNSLTDIREIAPDKTFYVRAVAEYADGQTVVSEASQLTTTAPAVGNPYPLGEDDYDNPKFLVLSVDESTREVTLVQIPEEDQTDRWRVAYEVSTNVDFKNPTQDEVLAIRSTLESDQTFCFYFNRSKTPVDLNSCTIEDAFIWTSDVSPSDDSSAISFNPATNETKEIEKTSQQAVWLIGTLDF